MRPIRPFSFDTPTSYPPKGGLIEKRKTNKNKRTLRRKSGIKTNKRQKK
jgi:hypothetical protein